MAVKRINVHQPPAKTAKVKFKKAIVLGHGEVAHVDDIYELPKHKATEFVNNGQAEYTDEGDESEGDDAGAAKHGEGYSTVTVEQPTKRDPRPKKK